MPDNKKLSLDELHHQKHKSSVRRFLFFVALGYVIVTMSAWLWWAHSSQKALDTSLARLKSELGPFHKISEEPIKQHDEQGAIFWIKKAVDEYPFKDIFPSGDKKIRDLAEKFYELEESPVNEIVSAVKRNTELFLELRKLFDTSFMYLEKAVQCQGDAAISSKDRFGHLTSLRRICEVYRWVALHDAINGETVKFSNKVITICWLANYLRTVDVYELNKVHDNIYLYDSLSLGAIFMELQNSEVLDAAVPYLDVSTVENRKAVLDIINVFLDQDILREDLRSNLKTDCSYLMKIIDEGKPIIRTLFPSINSSMSGVFEIARGAFSSLDKGRVNAELKEFLVQYSASQYKEQTVSESLFSAWYKNKIKGYEVVGIIDYDPYNICLKCKWEFMVIASRNVSATLLAIRLFEYDNGCLPVGIKDMVGKYLVDMPVDPFDPSKYIQMKKVSRDKICVYSIWVDYEDGGGYVREVAQLAGKKADDYGSVYSVVSK